MCNCYLWTAGPHKISQRYPRNNEQPGRMGFVYKLRDIMQILSAYVHRNGPKSANQFHPWQLGFTLRVKLFCPCVKNTNK